MTSETIKSNLKAKGISLGRWIHPSTGEKRIYVNARGMIASAKVWFIEDDKNQDFPLAKHSHCDVYDYGRNLHGFMGMKPWQSVANDVAECFDNFNWSGLVKITS